MDVIDVADEITKQVDRVRSGVEQHAAPGLVRIDNPLSALLGQSVDEADVDQDRVADRTRTDQTKQRIDLRLEAVAETNLKRTLRCVGSVGDGCAICKRDRERLLAQNAHARLERRERYVAMRTRWRGDDHAVESVRLEQVPIVGQAARGGRSSAFASSTRHVGAKDLVDAEFPQGRQVGLADSTQADDADAHQAMRHSGWRPAATRSTLSAQNIALRRHVPPLWPAVCGVATTLGSRSSGESNASGSLEKTSSPAPARRPSSSAATRAGSSTSGPRATLIRNALGFSKRSRRSSMMPCVCSFRCRWTDRTSTVGNRASMSSGVPRHSRPWLAASWSEMLRMSTVATRIPNARASVANAIPLAPKPIKPRSLPCNSSASGEYITPW